jgi:hypothetical protein
MSNININTKKTIFCVYGIIVLWLMGAHVTAFGQTKTKASKDTNLELDSLLEQFERDFTAARDQLAEEEYQKRGADIASWIKDATLPSPDNAALLYYQAFLLRPEPNMTINEKINEVLRGAESDRQIRTYLGHCRKMIQLAEVASQIPQCTWGIWHPDGHEFSVGDLASEVRRLTFILEVDARTLAADGHYRAALARCLTIRRLARHVGDDTVLLYSISRSHDRMSQRAIQYVLGVMSQDAHLLMWLRGQLAAVQGAPSSLAKMLQMDFESVLYGLRANAELLGKVRNQLAEDAESEQAREKAQNLTDEELLSRAREPYARFLDSILRVIDSDIPYEDKCAEIQSLTKKLKEEYSSDPAAEYVIFWSEVDGMVQHYKIHVRDAAYFNALKAAVEVYLVLAKTGQLPKKLPDGLPKDPFTGRNFIYEITDEGFALRCQGEEFQKGRIRRMFEFKVKSKG